MSLLKGIAFVALVVLADAQPAMAASFDPGVDAEIQEVVEKFRTSIINKDKATFLSPFYSDNPGHVIWQSVVDDSRLARLRKMNPEERKARRMPESNHLTLMDAITKPGAKPREEVFRNIVVDADGEIASVNFDYSYVADFKETNRRREMWHLVRTEAGWRIISVIFSVRDPASK